MEYERFAITVEDELLFVIPQYDESYIIMQGDDQIGVIHTEYIDNNLKWVSADLIAPDLVEKIGAAIEDHDM
jgi:hypothetical protein